MANASRDENRVTTLLAVSNVDGVTPVVVYADPVTHRLLVDAAGGTGTVTSVSVVSANGFAGSVANATTTPAITLTTTVTGILKGNGTAMSAAIQGTDYYAPGGTDVALADGGTGASLADPGADRIMFWDDSAGTVTWLTVGSGLTITDTTLTAAGGGGDVFKVGTPVDNQVGVWTGDGTLEGTANFTYDGSNLQVTGDIGSTGTRITKGWFVDLQVTNAIAGSITGNAATATALLNARTIGGVSFDGTANITVATATSGFTVSGGNLALGTNSITMSGSIGVTGTRVTKGWFTDLEVTNAIAGSITGSAVSLTNTRTIWGQNFNGTANVTGNLTLGASDLTMTGSLAATGARVTKGWFTDIESTNMPTVGGTSLTTVAQTFQNKTITNSNNVLGGVTMTLGSDADGDTYYRSSNVLTRLPKGTANQVLTMNAGATAPEWKTPSGSSFTPKGVMATIFETAARFGVNHSSGTATYDSGGVTLDTTSTGGRVANIILGMDGNNANIFTGSPMVTVGCRVLSIGTTGYFFLGIGLMTSITATANHIGFLIDIASGVATLKFSNANGTTQTLSAAITTLTNQDNLQVCFKKTSTTSIDFYYSLNGGAWSSATTHTTNIPTGSAGDGDANFRAANTTGQCRIAVESYYYER